MIEEHTITYGEFSVDAYPAVKLVGDKVYLNVPYLGKYRDMYYQTMIPESKFNEIAFKIQIKQACIVVMRIHVLDLKGKITDEIIQKIMPKAIAGV